ncbi:MAG: aspartyl protease [Candidatus Rokubacteria bacterium]|nr:aspartyl protease [Candidatus Rokubacteria bacterium]
MRVPIVVENSRTGARSEELIALADTGATLTVVPATTLSHIGIEPVGSVAVVLADGPRVSRRVGNAVIAIDGESAPCRVLFGEAGDAVLLGLTVLEQLGLAVDPVQRRLVPTDFLLY